MRPPSASVRFEKIFSVRRPTPLRDGRPRSTTPGLDEIAGKQTSTGFNIGRRTSAQILKVFINFETINSALFIELG